MITNRGRTINFVLNLFFVMTMAVANGCEVTTTELTIYPTERIIDRTIGSTVVLNCQPNNTSKKYHIQWKHYVGIERILLRTFNASSITVLNLSYLDAGRYRCMATAKKCVQKEITVNVQGTPAVIRKTEHVEMRDKIKITFTLEVISFPQPFENVTVGLCNGKEKEVFNVSWNSRLLTVRLKNLEYRVLGYQGNLSVSMEALPENGRYCVDISNKHGTASFHLYGNITGSPKDSENDGTLLSFLHKNMVVVTLGGLGLLLLLFLAAVIVLCKKLKTVENRRMSKLLNSIPTGTWTPISLSPSQSIKMRERSKTMMQKPTREPVPCSMKSFTLQNVQVKDMMYDDREREKNKSIRMDSRVYSFGQSDPDDYEYEDSF